MAESRVLNYKKANYIVNYEIAVSETASSFPAKDSLVLGSLFFGFKTIIAKKRRAKLPAESLKQLFRNSRSETAIS